MITSIQLPDALTYVGNIPELIIETTAPTVGFKISKGAELILTETYTVDEDGFARVVIRDFIDEQLQMNLPVGALFEQVDSVAVFTIEVTTGVEVDSFSFKAVKGGTNRISFDSAAFFASSWLTWQPQIKAVKYAQREHLSYYAQEQSVVKVKAYFSGGASEVITLHTLTAGGHYTMDVSFSLIRTLFTAQPIYFDVYVEGGTPTADKTWRQRYRLDAEPFEFEDFFLFENSLGGYDTIRLTGDRQATNPVEVDAALFYDEYQRDYQVTPRLAFEKNTGYFRSKQEMLWTEDFFQSIHRWYLLDGSLVEINLINPEFISLENQLMSLDFKFSYQKQSKYLSIREDVDTLYNPVIIGPDDDQYYLPPNLQTFPQVLAPTSTLMFPVQIPGQISWAFMTWGTMVSYLGGSVPHNSLSGLNQGEYQHLTASELAMVQGITRSLDAMGALIRYNFPSKVSGSAGEAPSDFVTVAQISAALTNANNWDTAFGWGNHANAGYALQSDLANYVTLDTSQNITGQKRFLNDLILGAASSLKIEQSSVFAVPPNGTSAMDAINTSIRFMVGVPAISSVAQYKDFSFETSALTNNILRTYTLPNSSGTLALLSDLGGYVTLNTNQTITGIKTFTNNIDLISAGGATGRLQSGTSAISLFTTSSADVSIGTNNLVRVIVGANGTTQFAGGIAVGGYTPSLSHAALFNGNVGIGTNNPQAQLHINGSISTGQFLITRTDFTGSGFSINAGDGNTTFNSFLPANLGFAGYVFRSTQGTQTLERMRIMPNGNVGIGTSSTAEKLHVSGGNIIVNPGYSFGWGDRSAQIIGYAYDTGYLRFDTNDGERMRITASGSVLIGTTTDNNNKLRIGGSLSSDGLTLLNFHHGVKTLVSDATSQFAINLTTTFPNMGLVSGNVWGVIGKCTFFRFGGVEVNQFHIGRNGSGTWSVATYGASSNTASVLSSVTGSGNSIFINMLSDSYVVVEITALVR